MKSGYIETLLIQAKKGLPFKEVTSMELIAGKGIEGDCHALGTDKQITLLSQKAKQWINIQEQQGLCFPNFKGNIITSEIDYSMITQGDIIGNGRAEMEITSCTKQCYLECTRIQNNLTCELLTGILYAKVVHSGLIEVGDCIRKMTNYHNTV